MNTYSSVAILIPSLNPDEKLLSLLADLREAAFEHIVVINDGSSADYDSYFEAARTQYGCTVLTHAVNQGKGRALKTAFHHVLTELPQCCSVTVDADGQHRIADIRAVAQETMEHPEALIFGCRDFSPKTSGVPVRSRFGNVLTSHLLSMLCGIKLSDTQTGLRGFSPQAMRCFLSTKGERYEFEMNMILDAKEHTMPLREVPIETVYIEDNRTSHFNPLKDSMRIYAVFGKFIAASLSSFVVDWVLFTLFAFLLKKVMPHEYAVAAAVVAARILSALFNYALNRCGVFKSKASKGRSMARYAVLCVVQVALSAAATSGLFALIGWGEWLWKPLVDVVLFFLSFRLQRGWVFK